MKREKLTPEQVCERQDSLHKQPVEILDCPDGHEACVKVYTNKYNVSCFSDNDFHYSVGFFDTEREAATVWNAMVEAL